MSSLWMKDKYLKFIYCTALWGNGEKISLFGDEFVLLLIKWLLQLCACSYKRAFSSDFPGAAEGMSAEKAVNIDRVLLLGRYTVFVCIIAEFLVLSQLGNMLYMVYAG